MDHDEIAKKAIGDILTKAGVSEDIFYKLADAVYAFQMIDQSSISFSMRANEFSIRAKYTGGKGIGKAREGRFGVSDEVKRNVREIYDEIACPSGIRFRAIYPDLYLEECIGYVDLEHDTRRESKLSLELFKD